LRITFGHDLNTRLNEGDVDIKDVVECEQEAHAKHDEKRRRKCPHLDSVLTGKHPASSEPCRCPSCCYKIGCHTDPLSPLEAVAQEGRLESHDLLVPASRFS